MKLLLATNNAHKIEEFRQIFAALSVALVSPAEMGLDLDPEETGTTFEANARIKAIAFSEASGLPVLADDSGLEVDALNGEPGVYSARYGDTAKDAHVERYRLILSKLEQVPWEQRTARFRCVIAVASQGEVVGVVDGTVEGYIGYEAKGEGGFGYDPIFYVPEVGCTTAQLTSAQKHSISHRGRAARAAIPLIEGLVKR